MVVPVRALLFDPTPGRLALAGAASRVRPLWALAGRAPTGLREVAEPHPPAPDWALLETVATGICGSDVKEVLLQASSDNPLSGLVSFPHVPGHEVVARVLESPVGSGLAPGALIALDPWLGCEPRRLETCCAACRAGFPPHCEMVGAGGPWGPGWGMHIGNVRGLPGGFAPRITAHRSQIHLLPPELDEVTGVLADPLAVAMHAVDQVPEDPGSVLVVGAGTVGLGLALAARRRWPRASLAVTCAWDHQRDLVRALGAEALPVTSPAVVQEVAARTGTKLARPWRGGPWTLGDGFGVVLDSIGSAQTLELALRSLRPRGVIVTVGVARPARAETTLTYFKEARILGSNGYGRGQSGLAAALDELARSQDLVRGWVAHRFPLRDWRRALSTAAQPDRSGAIKVAFTFQEEQPR